MLKKSRESWQAAGEAYLEKARNRNNSKRPAKNVILFIGDGMGMTTVSAARILEGQNLGLNGEEHNLSFDMFPNVGLAKVYETNQQTPDSAGTMSSIVTGVKTKAGVLSIDQDTARGDYSTVLRDRVMTIFERAEEAGLSTGVVSTARLTHATPAACYAHSAERNWENDSQLPVGAAEAGNKDIARQLIEWPLGQWPGSSFRRRTQPIPSVLRI